MDRDRFRVMVLASGSLALIVAATLVLDWFIANVAGMGFPITLGLREAKACVNGPCVTVPLSGMGGTYATLGGVTFFGGLAFAAVVAYQTGSRVLGGYASESVSKLGHGLGALIMLSAIGAGYLAGPSVGGMSIASAGATIERGWGPLAMLAGLIAGHVVLHLAALAERAYTPADQRTVAVAQARVPARAGAGSGSDAHDRAAPRERTKSPTAQLAPVPEHLKGKLKFATLSGELTRAGIDARREDGEAVLVMWRDVVGIVARRLPAEYGGAPFVDIVSTAGSTLRVLPWTRLSGDPVGGEGEARVKVLVGLLAERCPEAQFDPATKAYFGGTQPPAQLPDVATLDAHDQRLA